ncbi:hypothetical protein TeGR_g10909 [Tetraparma gracilis]|nr:hypothetical protein TeGR_g10909 [Tetraparma gracilis]
MLFPNVSLRNAIAEHVEAEAQKASSSGKRGVVAPVSPEPSAAAVAAAAAEKEAARLATAAATEKEAEDARLATAAAAEKEAAAAEKEAARPATAAAAEKEAEGATSPATAAAEKEVEEGVVQRLQQAAEPYHSDKPYPHAPGHYRKGTTPMDEDLKARFETLTRSTLMRRYSSADCEYTDTSTRGKIFHALPADYTSFTFGDLLNLAKKYGGTTNDLRIMMTHKNHQTVLPVGTPRVLDGRNRHNDLSKLYNEAMGATATPATPAKKATEPKNPSVLKKLSSSRKAPKRSSASSTTSTKDAPKNPAKKAKRAKQTTPAELIEEEVIHDDAAFKIVAKDRLDEQDLVALRNVCKKNRRCANYTGGHKRSCVWVCVQTSRLKPRVTPEHCMAIEILAEHGANVNLEADNGNTPLASALLRKDKQGVTKAIELLRKLNANE